MKLYHVQNEGERMIQSSKKIELSCSIKKVWSIMTNNKAYSWRSDISSIKIIDDTRFIEYTKKGYPTAFTITAKVECKEYRFKMKNSNMDGEWVGFLQILPNGNVELELTEQIEVNHFMMKLFAKPYLHHQQKTYIRDLKRELLK